jgi:hypothetical protein
MGSMVGYSSQSSKQERSPATHFVGQTKLTIEKYFDSSGTLRIHITRSLLQVT